MTRDELNQIYYISEEIKMWQKELSCLHDPEYIIKPVRIDGIPRSNQISDSTGDNATRALQIEEIINGLLVKLQHQRAEIYKFIATLEDSLLRQIIMHRCLSLCTWNEVAANIGGGNTADSCRKTFERYFTA